MKLTSLAILKKKKNHGGNVDVFISIEMKQNRITLAFYYQFLNKFIFKTEQKNRSYFLVVNYLQSQQCIHQGYINLANQRKKKKEHIYWGVMHTSIDVLLQPLSRPDNGYSSYSTEVTWAGNNCLCTYLSIHFHKIVTYQ